MLKQDAGKKTKQVAFVPPGSSRQVRFYQLLVAARKQWCMDALSEALEEADPGVIKEQIMRYVPSEAQRILAVAGIRDEHVFPLPDVILQKPSLVGYYRLLLGVPQKSFYKGDTGLGALKSMEETGACSPKQKELVPIFVRPWRSHWQNW